MRLIDIHTGQELDQGLANGYALPRFEDALAQADAAALAPINAPLQIPLLPPVAAEPVPVAAQNLTPTPNSELGIVGAVGSGGNFGEITALEDGGFVVTWVNSFDFGFSGFQLNSIGARVFNADGTPRTDAFRVSPTDGAAHTQPDVISLTDGGFAVAYASLDRTGGDGQDSFVRTFDADGTPRGESVLIASEIADDQQLPSLARTDVGFIAVWVDESASDFFDADIYGRYFNNAGQRSSDSFLIANVDSDILAPEVLITENCDVVVVTEVGTYSFEGNGSSRPFVNFTETPEYDAGDEVGSAVLGLSSYVTVSQEDDVLSAFISTSPALPPRRITVTDDAEIPGGMNAEAAVTAVGGGFVVSWQQRNADDNYDVYVQLFRDDGTKVGSNQIVHSGTDGEQVETFVTQLADGSVVVGWTSDQQLDGAAVQDLYFQSFDLPDGFGVADDGRHEGGNCGGLGLPIPTALELAVNSGSVTTVIDPDGNLLAPRSQGSGNIAQQNIGDFNGDGIDDLMVLDIAPDLFQQPVPAIFFGREGGLPSLDPENADVRIEIADARVSLATPIGDINGDGSTDLYLSNGNGVNFVLFGGADVSGPIDPDTLDGSNGFRILNEGSFTDAFQTGDLNGDGLGELLINEDIVVYSRVGNFAAEIDLQNLSGDVGFAIPTVDGLSRLRISVVQDLNGDGFDDLVISGRDTSFNRGNRSDAVYFGTEDGVSIPEFVAGVLNPDSTIGVALGSNQPVRSPQFQIGDIFDFNGDGLPDAATTIGDEIRVIFGDGTVLSQSPSEASIFQTDAVDLTLASDVIRDSDLRVGLTMDFNGDGFDDLVFARSDLRGAELLVVLGDDIQGNLELTADQILRIAIGPDSGSLTNIGDINADGIDDIGISLRPAFDDATNPDYLVVYGRESVTDYLGSTGSDVFTGGRGRDIARGLAGDDTLSGLGGNDLLVGNFGLDTLLGGDGDDILVGDNEQVLGGLEGQLFRAYQAIFDRAPDVEGFDLFLTSIRLGQTTIEGVIAQFVGSDEFQDLYGQLDAEGFLNLLYQNVLGRNADASGLAAYLDALEAGTLTRAQVVGDFIDSAEFIARTALDSFGFATSVILNPAFGDIFRLYQAVLDRAPDAAGFDNFVNALEAGALDLAAIAAEFVASAEFVTTYGDLDATEFVTALYANVFGREPDSEGLNAFVAALESGALSRAEVVIDFSQSLEFREQTLDAATAFVQATYSAPGDTLEGGAGSDLMFGGRGADVFVFDVAETGEDVVGDFETGTDVVQITGVADFDALFATATQSGADVLLQIGEDASIRLNNVLLDALSEGDFEFIGSQTAREHATAKAESVPVAEAPAHDVSLPNMWDLTAVDIGQLDMHDVLL